MSVGPNPAPIIPITSHTSAVAMARIRGGATFCTIDRLGARWVAIVRFANQMNANDAVAVTLLKASR